MGFDITSDLINEKMYPGMIISYKVSPILGIKNHLGNRNNSST